MAKYKATPATVKAVLDKHYPLAAGQREDDSVAVARLKPGVTNFTPADASYYCKRLGVKWLLVNGEWYDDSFSPYAP